MITLLDTIGPAIWRASWQAAVLTVLVLLLMWCFRERLSPRWRFLLWGVVLMRLLIVATPASPWSVFNLAELRASENAPIDTPRAVDSHVPPAVRVNPGIATAYESYAETVQIAEVQTKPSVVRDEGRNAMPTSAAQSMLQWLPAINGPYDAFFVVRVLSTLWIAGCLFLGAKLLANILMLRRRLSACRAVTDPLLLELLESCCRAMRLKRVPRLLVTPECVSPCVVGTWNPRIVLPESILTQSSPVQIRHVLVHELAHLMRGDLWANWLLLVTRIVHWFNPLAWWTVREMIAEREAACDEVALGVVGETERHAYAATIVELAAGLSPLAIAPGLIGFFYSSCQLRARLDRLTKAPQVKVVRTPVAVSLLLGIALIGLTDAIPKAMAQVPETTLTNDVAKEKSKANTHAVSGRCVDHVDDVPLPGITIKLYRVVGRTSEPEEIAKTVTDAEGRYSFTGLETPRPENQVDRLGYGVLGFADDRPIGIGFFHFDGRKQVAEIKMTRERGNLSGKVIDADGRPIAGAIISTYIVVDRPIHALASAITDADGRFKIEGLGVYKRPNGKERPTPVSVRHPDYVDAHAAAESLTSSLVVTLNTGCVATGTVIDAATGKPAAGAIVTAQRSDQLGNEIAATDTAGRFRLVIPEGRYDFGVDAMERVCKAINGIECIAGGKVEVPTFQLIEGGFIEGQVVNTVTGQAVISSEAGNPITIGLCGPSEPQGYAISPKQLAEVDKEGRFRLRAMPGDNFPYFKNTHGVRMAWDTQKQPPVIVKSGETTVYNMLITPKVSPEEKLSEARKLVATLSKEPSERTTQIIFEFRKLAHTVDECELWCSLMRELVAIGPTAVPQLCSELESTTEDRTIRRLAFALRAIGDPKAIPALIVAIPRTLLPGSSDYGLIVADKELMKFMQTHDLSQRGNGYFDLGRPGREVIGALQSLTKQNFDDIQIYSMSLSEDPRRQVLQRRVYVHQAQKWQKWWIENAKTFTDDAAAQSVELPVNDSVPDAKALSNSSRINGVFSEAVLCPASQGGQHAWHFFDLDANYRLNWPTSIPQGEEASNSKELADWARQNGVDLMCVTQRTEDGSETYVLRSFGMKVREIEMRELRNLDKSITSGNLPEGRAVGDLLMHYDAKLQKLVPDANGAFIFVTAEGNMGVIETTDRVIRAENLTGFASGSANKGVGFHKGVRFDLTEIIP